MSDGILFCGTGGGPVSASGRSALEVYRSENAGRTWKGPFHVAEVGAEVAVSAIYVSPRFRDDGIVFVSTGETAYLSRDRGQTFTRIGAGYWFDYRTTTIYMEGLAGAAQRPALIAIPVFTFTGPCCAYSFDSLVPGVARPLPPNIADWTFARHYLVPPDSGTTRTAVMIGRPGVRDGSPVDEVLSPHPKAYACDAAFNCTREIYDFMPLEGNGESWVGFTGTTYPGSPDSYVVTYDDPERPSLRLFRSRDHGYTWAPWSSATRLLSGLRWHAHVSVIASPDTPKRLFLFVSADEAAPAYVPEQRLFRSDDDGRTWRSLGHAWGPTQTKRSASTLPWNSTGYGYQVPVAGPGGRLYVPAAWRVGPLGKDTTRTSLALYCSRDYGRSWARTC